MARAGEDVGQVFLVRGRDRADLAIVHQLGEADDAVQGRAQLMRHVGEELALEAVGLLHAPVLLLQLFVLAAKLLAQAALVGDVADRSAHQDALAGLERAETDLDGKFTAVLAPAIEIEARAHRTHARLVEEGVALGGVAGAKTVGDEHLHLVAQKFLPRVAEELFRLRVDQDDLAVVVDDHHRVGRRLEQAAKFFLGAAAVGDVAHRGADEHALLGSQRAEADLDRELGAVPAQALQVEPCSHRAHARVVEISLAVDAMLLAEALGHQHLDGLP